LTLYARDASANLVRWTITTPPDRASFTLPILPTDVAGTWPGSSNGAVTTEGTYVRVDEASYATARAIDTHTLLYGPFAGATGTRAFSSTEPPPI
jgi:hypothetical protein